MKFLQVLIIDFSLCEFVDHTVMEGLNDYSRNFSRQSGFFEIIGLDIHEAKTEHPLPYAKAYRVFPFEFSSFFNQKAKAVAKIITILDWDYLLNHFQTMAT